MLWPGKGAAILWVTKPTCADVLFPLEETLTEGDCEKGFFFPFLSGLMLVCYALFCGCCYKELLGADYLETGWFSSVLKVEGHSTCTVEFWRGLHSGNAC